MIDLQTILDSLGVQYRTSGKNNIKGCYSIKCPMCDDHSMHGNIDPENGSYKCWRCKGSSLAVVLSKASGTPISSISRLLKDFKTSESSNRIVKKEYAKELVVPGGSNPMPVQTEYLKGRGLDPSTLEFYYGIKYGRLGEKANDINVSLRIIIPVLDEYGTPVAWQARDTTGKSELRYVFPRSSECLEDSKHTLYGAHLCRDRRRIVVVEGVFDAWKVGSGAVCTFGTSVTPRQIELMSKWEEVVIAFDAEPEAQSHAREIAMKLAPCGVDVYIADTNFGTNPDGSARDLGDCTPEEIKEFRKKVGLD